jgi:hypothetical protein
MPICTDAVSPRKVRERAAAYIAAIGPAVEGQHGDDHTYKVATVLVVDFALPQDDALDLMRAWNATCQPPWEERDLLNKLRGAAKYGRGELGAKRVATPAAHDGHARTRPAPTGPGRRRRGAGAASILGRSFLRTRSRSAYDRKRSSQRRGERGRR